MKTSFNKFIYTGFILIGLFELFIIHDVGNAATYLGIALAFDPFNQEQAWKERPKWQKIVLIIHVAIVFGLFGYIIGNSNNTFKK